MSRTARISSTEEPRRIGNTRPVHRRGNTTRSSLRRPVTGLPRGFGFRLAAHAACRLGQEAEPLGGDLLPAVLANPIFTLRAPTRGTLRLPAILFEQALDALAAGAVAEDRREVAFC